jgi:glycerol-3-phosphate cytidylyltransferase-like family protein
VILACGAFDGLHAGHVRYLKAAACLKQPNEELRVAVAPAGYIEQAKGRSEYWHQGDRCETVAAVAGVDLAFVYVDPSSVAEVVRGLKPRVFVKGMEWAGNLPVDVIDACSDVGCQIVYVHTPGRHTSEARA